MEPRLKGTAFCGETCEYIKSTETPFISHWLISVILIRTPKLVQILPKSKKKQEQLWFKIRPTWLPFTFLSGLTLFHHLLNGLCFCDRDGFVRRQKRSTVRSTVESAPTMRWQPSTFPDMSSTSSSDRCRHPLTTQTRSSFGTPIPGVHSDRSQISASPVR